MERTWISFEDALAETKERRRHLLLGNGFSKSKHSLFGYPSLYAEALRHDPGLAPLFAEHGTNFEYALGAADGPDSRIRIRKALVAAIGTLHPVRRFLSATDCETCATFLELFAGVAREPFRGRVFTTNYDLLLYWVLMQSQKRLKLYDGFDNDGVWRAGLKDNTWLFYLHGALHHFEEDIGAKTRHMRQYKLKWRDGMNLPTQVRTHIAKGAFPIFVSEGTSPEKVRSIQGNAYLRWTRRALTEHCTEANSSVFTFGHSLDRVDDHIVEALAGGNATLYLGVHRPTSDGGRAVALLQDWAKSRPALQAKLFDTSECAVWAAEYAPSAPSAEPNSTR